MSQEKKSQEKSRAAVLYPLALFLFTLLLCAAVGLLQTASAQEIVVSDIASLNPAGLSNFAEPEEGEDDPYAGEDLTPTQQLALKYKRTGRAEVLRQSNSLKYPYGHSQPIVRCAPLRVCQIVLQEGEIIYDVSTGDPDRWAFDSGMTGPEGRTTIKIRPLNNSSKTTNLIVNTSKRSYHLTLDTEKVENAGRNPQGDYMRQVAFYYPEEELRKLSRRRERQRVEEVEQANEVRLPTECALTDMNFGYEWDKGENFPFAPQSVYDCAGQTYIKLPPNEGGVMPLLFEKSSSGDLVYVNYAVRNGFYIADRVFDEAVFVIGVDKKIGFLGLGGKERTRQSLTIKNENR